MKSTRKLESLMKSLVVVCVLLCLTDIVLGIGVADGLGPYAGLLIGLGGPLLTILLTYLLYTVLEVFAEMVRNTYASSYYLSILVNDAHPAVPVLDDPDTAAEKDDDYDEDENEDENEGEDEDAENRPPAVMTADKEIRSLRNERAAVVRALTLNPNLTAVQRQTLEAHLKEIDRKIEQLRRT